MSCLMQSLVYVHCQRTRDVSGGPVVHMHLIAKCTDIRVLHRFACLRTAGLNLQIYTVALCIQLFYKHSFEVF
jgi:hypothetical protein